MPTEELPSNSRLNRPEPTIKKTEEKKDVKSVIEGKATRRKKPFHKRVVETFIGDDDAAGVMSYVVQDVIVPATKDLLSDAVTTIVERVLFGESVGTARRRRGTGLGSRVDYAGISSRTIRRDEPRGREMSVRGRAAHDFSEIILDSRGDCEIVLEEMYEIYSKYDVVTVADLYSLTNQSSSFVDTKYGWEGPDALAGAHAVRIKGGYLLDLPRPEPIK